MSSSSSSAAVTTTTFISGHCDISEDEFFAHYKYKIDAAIAAKDQFVVGSARGADRYVLEYLSMYIPESEIYYRVRCFIYERSTSKHKLAIDFCKQHSITAVTGFSSYEERDAAMTRLSDRDIAWVRSAEENRKKYGKKWKPTRTSGTENNLIRRKKITERARQLELNKEKERQSLQ